MKKTFLLVAAVMMMSAGSAFAQNTIVVDTEKVFTSIAAYNSAMEEINSLTEKYQKEIETAYDELEQAFNTFQSRRESLSATERQQTEQRILNREQEIIRYKEKIFGADGTLFTRRVELITPIQEKVMAVVKNYADSRNIDIVLDNSSNAAILYHKPSADHTDAIIKLLNNN